MKTVIAILLFGLVAHSHGVVNIDWYSTYGFYFGSSNPGVGILGDGTGNSTIAQLIYSLDGNVDDALVGGSTSGDDVIWATKTITEDGIANDGIQFDSYAWFDLPNNYQQAFVSGNVYARIFQDNSVGAGDWYYYTSLMSLVDITGINPPQTINMASSDFVSISSGSNVAQVVPEPATFLLFGMGGFGAWLVRRNRLKAKEEA